MTDDQVPIDHLLAAALRGEDADWPPDWSGSEQVARITERIAYHGIAGLIAGEALANWPAAVLAPVREQAIALAMWELRHKAILGELFAAFAEEKIVALLLKGTAVAYDLYPSPATRARGDSDLLIAPADLGPARSILARLGYRCQPLDAGIADDLALPHETRRRSRSYDARSLTWACLSAPKKRLRAAIDNYSLTKIT